MFDEEASRKWNDEPEDYKFLLFSNDHDETSDIVSPPTTPTSPINHSTTKHIYDAYETHMMKLKRFKLNM